MAQFLQIGPVSVGDIDASSMSDGQFLVASGGSLVPKTAYLDFPDPNAGQRGDVLTVRPGSKFTKVAVWVQPAITLVNIGAVGDGSQPVLYASQILEQLAIWSSGMTSINGQMLVCYYDPYNDTHNLAVYNEGDGSFASWEAGMILPAPPSKG